MRSNSNNNGSFKKFYKKDKNASFRSNGSEGRPQRRKFNKFSDSRDGDGEGLGFKKKRFGSDHGGSFRGKGGGKFPDRNHGTGGFSDRKGLGGSRGKGGFNSDGEQDQAKEGFKRRSFGGPKRGFNNGGSGYKKSGSGRGFRNSRNSSAQDGDQRSFRSSGRNYKDQGFKGKDFREGRSFHDRGFQKDRPSDGRRSGGSFEDRPRRNYGDRDGSKRFERNSDDRPRRNYGNRDGSKRFERNSDDRPRRDYGNRDGSKRFERNSDNRPRKEKPLNIRTFEEKDLSFGKKPVNPEPETPKEPEVTFSKEIENKWQSKNPPRAHFKAKSYPESEEERHPTKEKGVKRFTGDDDDQPQRVYSANERGRKRTRIPNDYGDHKFSEDEMPLNKYIAYCDVCGRREAAQLVKEGKVKVNGELITEPGHRVTEKDQVSLSGKKLTLQKNMLYLLLNKPKGFITTTDDPKGRRTVMDLFVNQIDERIYPVGRLDRNTTGILLLTNDGDLAQSLAHPSNGVKKVYQAVLDKPLEESDFQKIKEGVSLEDGVAPVDDLAYLESRNEIGLEIHNGKNRIVRRIFESVGYEVVKLDRVMYAGLTKKDVPRGKWRPLTKQEVINLKHLRKK